MPPRWTVEPIDQDAVVGHGVSIACQAEGFPIPTVTWKQSIGKSRLLKGGISMLENSLSLSLFPSALREMYYALDVAREMRTFLHLKALSKHETLHLIQASYFFPVLIEAVSNRVITFFFTIRTSLLQNIYITFALFHLTRKFNTVLFDASIITFPNNFFLHLTFIIRELCLRGHYVIFIKVARTESEVDGGRRRRLTKKKRTRREL